MNINQKNKQRIAASKQKFADELRKVALNNYALTSYALVIFAITSPALYFLSLRQNFFDRTFNLSPFKVFYFFSIGLLILISLGFSKKSLVIKEIYYWILFPLIPISNLIILFSSDWSVFLHSQPDRFKTYTSVTTYLLAGFLTFLILNKNKTLSFLLNAI